MNTMRFRDRIKRMAYGLVSLLAQASTFFPAPAEGQGDSVVVIYNSNLADSKVLAQ